jgi:hypothetical protein
VHKGEVDYDDDDDDDNNNNNNNIFPRGIVFLRTISINTPHKGDDDDDNDDDNNNKKKNKKKKKKTTSHTQTLTSLTDSPSHTHLSNLLSLSSIYNH